MMTTLGRTHKSFFSRFETFLGVIAPRGADVPQTFPNVTSEADLHRSMIEMIQRFRGEVYVDDGAIPASDLDVHGRHCSPYDEQSWHFFTFDPEMRVTSCLRLIPYTERIHLSDLRMDEVVNRLSPAEQARYRGAVGAFIDSAFGARLGLAESGAWAIHKDMRRSSKAIVLAASGWSLGQLLGDYLCVSSSTTRHHVVDILRRLGAFPLEFEGQPLPPFFDSHYQCEMQLMGFDSRRPASEFAQTVQDIKEYLQNALILVP
jgi:hypothetical protein